VCWTWTAPVPLIAFQCGSLHHRPFSLANCFLPQEHGSQESSLESFFLKKKKELKLFFSRKYTGLCRHLSDWPRLLQQTMPSPSGCGDPACTRSTQSLSETTCGGYEYTEYLCASMCVYIPFTSSSLSLALSFSLLSLSAYNSSIFYLLVSFSFSIRCLLSPSLLLSFALKS